MRARAVYVDLDGTLLDPERRVTDHTRRVLARLAKLGVQIGVATGRTLRSARPFIDAAHAAAPAVLFNGGRIQSVAGEVYYDSNLPSEAAVALVRLARDHEVFVNCYHGDDISIEDRCARARASAAKDGVEQTLIADLGELVADRAPTKLMMIAPPGEMDRFEPLARRAVARLGADLVRSEPEYLEAMAVGVNKGSGLARAVAIAGVSLAETVAFGDSANDIDMLRAAGLGVAMGNAASDVRAAADRVCGRNDEDGVARFLEALFHT